MSFICDYCQKPAPRGTKPLMAVPDTCLREKIYTEPQKVGNEVHAVIVGHGTERTIEFRKCVNCQELPIKPTVNRNETYKAVGLVIHEHARKCEKPLAECGICQRNMKTCQFIPPQDLSNILSNKAARPVRYSLGSLVVDALIDRSTHKSKRAQADYSTAFAVLKAYEERGGKI